MKNPNASEEPTKYVRELIKKFKEDLLLRNNKKED